jgi:hypothetical protein
MAKHMSGARPVLLKALTFGIQNYLEILAAGKTWKAGHEDVQLEKALYSSALQAALLF